MKLDIGLRFAGNCEEAFIFYQSVFGGELFMLQRYKEMREHGYTIAKKDENNIAFVGLKVSDNFILAGDDFNKSFNTDFVTGSNFALGIGADSKADADRLYKALSAGGQQEAPMIDVYWGEYCGSVRDKFGILWNVNYHYPKT
jgi:PhnB protein